MTQFNSYKLVQRATEFEKYEAEFKSEYCSLGAIHTALDSHIGSALNDENKCDTFCMKLADRMAVLLHVYATRRYFMPSLLGHVYVATRRCPPRPAAARRGSFAWLDQKSIVFAELYT